MATYKGKLQTGKYSTTATSVSNAPETKVSKNQQIIAMLHTTTTTEDHNLRSEISESKSITKLNIDDGDKKSTKRPKINCLHTLGLIWI